MEISGKNPLAGLNSGVQRLEATQQPERATKTGGESPKADGDRVELSVRSREIQHLDELIRSTSDIREAKVEQVKSAIEAGTYNVKAEKIADKILGDNLLDEVY
jgi:negative regulator of flagellin synthesis FlgM